MPIGCFHNESGGIAWSWHERLERPLNRFFRGAFRNARSRYSSFKPRILRRVHPSTHSAPRRLGVGFVPSPPVGERIGTLVGTAGCESIQVCHNSIAFGYWTK